jgi:hypothetical protein
MPFQFPNQNGLCLIPAGEISHIALAFFQHASAMLFVVHAPSFLWVS